MGEKSSDNYRKIVRAFSDFGMLVFDMTEENFLHNDHIDVFSFGVPPIRIDLMTQTKGVKFEDCFEQAELYPLDNIQVKVIQIDDLIKAKKAAGRPKDLDDIENLRHK